VRLILGDAHITLPGDVVTTDGQSSGRVQRYRISGRASSVEEARNRVIDAAIEVGYELFLRPRVVTLVRGERRIVVSEVDALELVVCAYSTARFPAPTGSEPALALGRLWIEVPKASIVATRAPKKAQTDAGGTVWEGQWELRGQDPRAVFRGVLDSLAAHGLECSGPFAARDAGVATRWSGEATGPNTRVKASATPVDDRIVLELVLLDDEPEA
jgi:hypothetical protein